MTETGKFQIGKVVAVSPTSQYRRLMGAAEAVTNCIGMPDLSLTDDERLDLRFSVNQQSNPQNFIAVSSFVKTAEGNIIPKEIVLHPEHPELPLTYIHELGHCFDYFCKKPYGYFSSCFEEEFAEWRIAVYASEAYHLLGQSVKAKRIVFENVSTEQLLGFKKTPELHEALVRAYEDHEIWARAFCQYVVTDERNAEQEKWLGPMLDGRRDRYRNYACPLYWTAGDFKPIRDAMHAMFERR